MKLTDKQQDVLTTIVKGNPDGTFCDLDQVIENVTYKTNKPSIQFVIRNLIGKGLIEKKARESRRGRRRVVLGATKAGYIFVSRSRLSGAAEMKKIVVESSEGSPNRDFR